MNRDLLYPFFIEKWMRCTTPGNDGNEHAVLEHRIFWHGETQRYRGHCYWCGVDVQTASNSDCWEPVVPFIIREQP